MALDVALAQELSLGLIEHQLDVLVQEPAEIADAPLALAVKVVIDVVPDVGQHMLHILKGLHVHL